MVLMGAHMHSVSTSFNSPIAMLSHSLSVVSVQWKTSTRTRATRGSFGHSTGSVGLAAAKGQRLRGV